MHNVSLALFVVSVALFVVSLVWSLTVRGKTTTRSGPEIGEELMKEKAEAESLRRGRASATHGAIFFGKGWAFERVAEYSYAEVRQMLREGRLAEALPALLGLTSVVGMPAFGGLTMVLWPRAHFVVALFGAVFVAFAGYALYVLVSGFRRE